LRGRFCHCYTAISSHDWDDRSGDAALIVDGVSRDLGLVSFSILFLLYTPVYADSRMVQSKISNCQHDHRMKQKRLLEFR
jgi:hypothetical protein